MTAQAQEPLKVLLVEDHPESNRLFREFLRGFDVRSAFSGPEALDLLAKEPFDIIVLDIMMTPIDGIETCRRIRNELGIRDVPICMITADLEIERVVHAFEAGANGYIVKPFDSEELITKIRELTGF